MVHFRKSIRDKAASLLTGLTTTGANVFSGRVAPLAETELPGLVVVPGAESADFGPEIGGASVERNLQLIVIAEAIGNDGLFDTLDTIAGEVETALFAPLTDSLDGLAMVVGPPETQMTVSDREGSSERIGTMRMVFPVRYRTSMIDPTVQA